MYFPSAVSSSYLQVSGSKLVLFSNYCVSLDKKTKSSIWSTFEWLKTVELLKYDRLVNTLYNFRLDNISKVGLTINIFSHIKEHMHNTI